MLGLLLFTVSFVAYLKTLCPTIYVGDSGELITAGSCLGIPHPPGYPIFVLLIKLTAIIMPFGSLAFRAALTSAIAGAAGVLVLFRICLWVLDDGLSNSAPNAPGTSRKTLHADRRGPVACASAALAAGVFAFSMTFWSQTTVAEVYSLALLFILLLFLLVFRWRISASEGVGETRLLLAASFLGGLGLASHHTVALLLAGLAIYVVAIRPRLLLKPGLLFGAIGFGLLGASVHLYLAIRAGAAPPLNWGEPETFKAFVAHIFRQEYGSPSEVERTLSLFFKQSGYYVSQLLRQFTPLNVVLVVVGLVSLIKRLSLIHI